MTKEEIIKKCDEQIAMNKIHGPLFYFTMGILWTLGVEAFISLWIWILLPVLK